MINVNSSPINPSTPSGDGSKEGWTNNPKVNQPDMLHTSGIIITNVQSDDVRSKTRGHSSKNTVATPMKMTARSTSSEELSSGSEGFNLSEVKGGSVLEKIKPYLPSMPSIRLPWSQQQGSASILVAEKITPQEDDIEKGDAIPPQPRFTPEDVKSAWKGIISSGYTVLPGIPIIILIGLGRGICKGFEAGKQYGGSLLGLMGWIPGMFYGMYEQYGDVRKEAEAFAENFTAKMNAEEDTAAKSAYVGVGTGLCCMGCALSLVGSALYSIVRSPVTLYEKYQERQGSSTKQAVETANKCCNDIQEKLRSVGSAEEAKKIRELFNQAKQLVKYASDHAKSVSPNYLIEKVMPVGDRLYGNDDAPIGLETSIQDTATSYLHQAKELINGLNSFLNRAEDATENLADLRDEMGEVHGSIRDSMNIAVALDPSLKKNVDALLKQADAALQKLDAKIEREKELWKGDKSVKGLEGLEVATKTPDTKVKEDLINSIMLYFSEEQQTQWVKENGQNVRGNTLLEQVTSIVNHMSPVTQREALDKVEKQARINTRLRSLIEFGANEEFYMDLAIESQKQQEKQEAIQARDKKFKEFASQKLTGAFAEGETSAIIKINDLTTWPDDKKAKWIERNKGDLVIPSTCTKLDDKITFILSKWIERNTGDLVIPPTCTTLDAKITFILSKMPKEEMPGISTDQLQDEKKTVTNSLKTAIKRINRQLQQLSGTLANVGTSEGKKQLEAPKVLENCYKDLLKLDKTSRHVIQQDPALRQNYSAVITLLLTKVAGFEQGIDDKKVKAGLDNLAVKVKEAIQSHPTEDLQKKSLLDLQQALQNRTDVNNLIDKFDAAETSGAIQQKGRLEGRTSENINQIEDRRNVVSSVKANLQNLQHLYSQTDRARAFSCLQEAVQNKAPNGKELNLLDAGTQRTIQDLQKSAGDIKTIQEMAAIPTGKTLSHLHKDLVNACENLEEVIPQYISMVRTNEAKGPFLKMIEDSKAALDNYKTLGGKEDQDLGERLARLEELVTTGTVTPVKKEPMPTTKSLTEQADDVRGIIERWEKSLAQETGLVTDGIRNMDPNQLLQLRESLGDQMVILQNLEKDQANVSPSRRLEFDKTVHACRARVAALDAYVKLRILEIDTFQQVRLLSPDKVKVLEIKAQLGQVPSLSTEKTKIGNRIMGEQQEVSAQDLWNNMARDIQAKLSNVEARIGINERQSKYIEDLAGSMGSLQILEASLKKNKTLLLDADPTLKDPAVIRMVNRDYLEDPATLRLAEKVLQSLEGIKDKKERDELWKEASKEVKECAERLRKEDPKVRECLTKFCNASPALQEQLKGLKALTDGLTTAAAAVHSLKQEQFNEGVGVQVEGLLSKAWDVLDKLIGVVPEKQKDEYIQTIQEISKGLKEAFEKVHTDHDSLATSRPRSNSLQTEMSRDSMEDGYQWWYAPIQSFLSKESVTRSMDAEGVAIENMKGFSDSFVIQQRIIQLIGAMGPDPELITECAPRMSQLITALATKERELGLQETFQDTAPIVLAAWNQMRKYADLQNQIFPSVVGTQRKPTSDSLGISVSASLQRVDASLKAVEKSLQMNGSLGQLNQALGQLKRLTNFLDSTTEYGCTEQDKQTVKGLIPRLEKSLAEIEDRVSSSVGQDESALTLLENTIRTLGDLNNVRSNVGLPRIQDPSTTAYFNKHKAKDLGSEDGQPGVIQKDIADITSTLKGIESRSKGGMLYGAVISAQDQGQLQAQFSKIEDTCSKLHAYLDLDMEPSTRNTARLQAKGLSTIAKQLTSMQKLTAVGLSSSLNPQVEQVKERIESVQTKATVQDLASQLKAADMQPTEGGITTLEEVVAQQEKLSAQVELLAKLTDGPAMTKEFDQHCIDSKTNLAPMLQGLYWGLHQLFNAELKLGTKEPKAAALLFQLDLLGRGPSTIEGVMLPSYVSLYNIVGDNDKIGDIPSDIITLDVDDGPRMQQLVAGANALLEKKELTPEEIGGLEGVYLRQLEQLTKEQDDQLPFADRAAIMQGALQIVDKLNQKLDKSASVGQKQRCNELRVLFAEQHLHTCMTDVDQNNIPAEERKASCKRLVDLFVDQKRQVSKNSTTYSLIRDSLYKLYEQDPKEAMTLMAKWNHSVGGENGIDYPVETSKAAKGILNKVKDEIPWTVSMTSLTPEQAWRLEAQLSQVYTTNDKDVDKELLVQAKALLSKWPVSAGGHSGLDKIIVVLSKDEDNETSDYLSVNDKQNINVALGRNIEEDGSDDGDGWKSNTVVNSNLSRSSHVDVTLDGTIGTNTDDVNLSRDSSLYSIRTTNDIGLDGGSIHSGDDIQSIRDNENLEVPLTSTSLYSDVKKEDTNTAQDKRQELQDKGQELQERVSELRKSFSNVDGSNVPSFDQDKKVIEDAGKYTFYPTKTLTVGEFDPLLRRMDEYAQQLFKGEQVEGVSIGGLEQCLKYLKVAAGNTYISSEEKEALEAKIRIINEDLQLLSLREDFQRLKTVQLEQLLPLVQQIERKLEEAQTINVDKQAFGEAVIQAIQGKMKEAVNHDEMSVADQNKPSLSIAFIRSFCNAKTN